jgi:RNA polymerase sigma-B factor
METAGAATRMPREQELWRRWGEGDRGARDGLVALYLPLARRLARRYAGVVEPYDDLLQVASLGLLNAIERFDPAAGTPFTAFARPTIDGELKRHLRDKVWTVRVPRSLHDLIARIDAAIEELSADGGRAPSVGEIARRLDLEPTAVLEAMEADQRRRMVSLDVPPASEPDGPPRAELIAGEEDDFDRVEDRLTIGALLNLLDDEERELLRMRFVEDVSQRVISRRVGRSQMYVSRHLRGVLEQLREAAAGSGTGA